MAISTYSDLQTEIAAWLNRDNLTQQIQSFISLATARLSDELRAPEMETVATTTISAEWTSLPSDFRAIRLLETGGKVLEYRTPWQLQKLVEAEAYLTPGYYTIQDMQFRIYPTPSSATVELTYYAAIPDLVSGLDSNWLLRKRPDVYLQAGLFYGWQFLQDDERMLRAGGFVDKYVAETNRNSKQIMYGSTPLAVRTA